MDLQDTIMNQQDEQKKNQKKNKIIETKTIISVLNRADTAEKQISEQETELMK